MTIYKVLEKMNYNPGFIKSGEDVIFQNENSLILYDCEIKDVENALTKMDITFFTSKPSDSLIGIYCFNKKRNIYSNSHIGFSKTIPSNSHIYIPYEKNLSPQYLDNIKNFLLKYRTSDKELTLDEFVKTHHIIKEENYTSFEKEILIYTENELKNISKNWKYNKNNFFLWEEKEDKKYYIGKYKNILLLEYKGEIAGGVIGGTRYILPEFRRKGLGIDIVVFCHYNPQFKLLFPSHYSEDGYNTRIKAFDIIKNNAKLEKKI